MKSHFGKGLTVRAVSGNMHTSWSTLLCILCVCAFIHGGIHRRYTLFIAKNADSEDLQIIFPEGELTQTNLRVWVDQIMMHYTTIDWALADSEWNDSSWELIALWVDCIGLIAIRVNSSLAFLLFICTISLKQFLFYYWVWAIDLKCFFDHSHHDSDFQMRSVQSLLQHLPTGAGERKDYLYL